MVFRGAPNQPKMRALAVFGDVMDSPENLVKKFILASKNGGYESMKIAKETYQILINTYCSKNVIPQGISFGSK